MADLSKEVKAVLGPSVSVSEKAEKRRCLRCGKEEGETIIAKGRLGKGPDGYFPEWLCNACLCLGEEKNVFPAKYLLELIRQKNESRPEAFKERQEFWKRVAAGKTEPPDDKGDATHFAVVGTRVVGIDKVDAAAMAKGKIDIKVFKNRRQAEEAAEKARQKRELFEGRKESWRKIASGEKSFGSTSKKEGDCEHPDCKKRAAEGYGVVNGKVVILCSFCSAALYAVKREGGCEELVFFRGEDAMERVKRHLAWLRNRPGNKGFTHRPFLEVINGGEKKKS